MLVVLFRHGKRHGHTGAEARRVGHGDDSRPAGRASRLVPHAVEPRTVCALGLAQRPGPPKSCRPIRKKQAEPRTAVPAPRERSTGSCDPALLHDDHRALGETRGQDHTVRIVRDHVALGHGAECAADGVV